MPKVQATNKAQRFYQFFMLYCVLQSTVSQGVQVNQEHEVVHDNTPNSPLEILQNMQGLLLTESKATPTEWVKVTTEVLAKKIAVDTTVDTEDTKTVVSNIMAARKLSKVYREYIDIALNYNPDMEIRIVPSTHPQLKRHDKVVVYISKSKEMLINQELLTAENFVVLMAHEFIHAANDAIAMALHSKHDTASQPYFPDSNKDKYLSLIELGDQRIANITDLTAHAEAAQALNQPPYHDTKVWTLATPPRAANYFKEKGINIHEKVGEVLNLDHFYEQPPGDFRLKKVVVNNKGEIVLHVTCLNRYPDPVARLKEMIPEMNEMIKKKYKPYQFIREKQAYLYERLPLKILRLYYLEMLEYDLALRESIRKKPIPAPKVNSANPLARTLLNAEAGIEGLVNNLDRITPDNAEQYVTGIKGLIF